MTVDESVQGRAGSLSTWLPLLIGKSVNWPGAFRARGTLVKTPVLSPGKRAWLITEFLLLFIGAPLAMQYAVFHYQVPLFYALPPVMVFFIAMLLFDRSFNLKREVRHRLSQADLKSILIIFAGGVLVVSTLVSLILPDHMFKLAAERPGKWLKIMTLYPFTSVLAQEFVYRVFFFHRYGPLFPNKRSIILANAFVFGFGHIIFRNWIAVIGTFVVGALLAWRYERTRSFWAVYVEHVLWGWLVFTIGLGVYFFTGVANPAW